MSLSVRHVFDGTYSNYSWRADIVKSGLRIKICVYYDNAKKCDILLPIRQFMGREPRSLKWSDYTFVEEFDRDLNAILGTNFKSFHLIYVRYMTMRENRPPNICERNCTCS